MLTIGSAVFALFKFKVALNLQYSIKNNVSRLGQNMADLCGILTICQITLKFFTTMGYSEAEKFNIFEIYFKKIKIDTGRAKSI